MAAEREIAHVRVVLDERVLPALVRRIDARFDRLERIILMTSSATVEAFAQRLDLATNRIAERVRAAQQAVIDAVANTDAATQQAVNDALASLEPQARALETLGSDAADPVPDVIVDPPVEDDGDELPPV